MKSSAGKSACHKNSLKRLLPRTSPVPRSSNSLQSPRTSAWLIPFSLACRLFRFPSQIKLPQKNLEFAFSFPSPQSSSTASFAPPRPHPKNVRQQKTSQQSVTNNETQNQTVNHPTELSCLRSLSRIIFAFFFFFISERFIPIYLVMRMRFWSGIYRVFPLSELRDK